MKNAVRRFPHIGNGHPAGAEKKVLYRYLRKQGQRFPQNKVKHETKGQHTYGGEQAHTQAKQFFKNPLHKISIQGRKPLVHRRSGAAKRKAPALIGEAGADAP